MTMGARVCEQVTGQKKSRLCFLCTAWEHDGKTHLYAQVYRICWVFVTQGTRISSYIQVCVDREMRRAKERDGQPRVNLGHAVLNLCLPLSSPLLTHRPVPRPTPAPPCTSSFIDFLHLKHPAGTCNQAIHLNGENHPWYNCNNGNAAALKITR